jgi:hypothetical protein
MVLLILLHQFICKDNKWMPFGTSKIPPVFLLDSSCQTHIGALRTMFFELLLTVKYDLAVLGVVRALKFETEAWNHLGLERR